MLQWVEALLHRRRRERTRRRDMEHTSPSGDRLPLKSLDEIIREWGL